jgi:hypothetical protein
MLAVISVINLLLFIVWILKMLPGIFITQKFRRINFLIKLPEKHQKTPGIKLLLIVV